MYFKKNVSKSFEYVLGMLFRKSTLYFKWPRLCKHITIDRRLGCQPLQTHFSKW